MNTNTKPVRYGTVERSKIIDDNGSTVTQIKKYEDYVAVGPERLRFAIRHRTDKTSLQTIAEIANDLLNDLTKLDAELKLEKTKSGEQQGYFNLVECYTVLEY